MGRVAVLTVIFPFKLVTNGQKEELLKLLPYDT